MVYQQVISLASLLRRPALLYRLLNILHWLLDILLVGFISRVLVRELESSVFFSFKLTTTTCKVRVMFLLQTPFSSSHSRGSRWRHLTNFPVNSALMVAMLVKPLIVLIASNTSFREASVPSVVNASFHLFLFSFFLHDCRSFPMQNGNFLFGYIKDVATLCEASWSFSWSTFARSWASWRYFSSSLARGFGVWSSL